MEYTVAGLAGLSGVSPRTLRFYDRTGLLKPARLSTAGYRLYGPAEVERLRRILILRELGMPLAEISRTLSAPDFDPAVSLRAHLERLRGERERINGLIRSVEKSISEQEGRIVMTDQEKFEGFKRGLIEENERKYGAEIREKYGEEAVEGSNRKLMGMSEEQYAETEALSAEVNRALAEALALGDPAGPEAMRACELHKKWLCRYWTEYSPEAHMGLGRMYVEDERFRAYYNSVAPGAAVFLRDALAVFTGIRKS